MARRGAVALSLCVLFACMTVAVKARFIVESHSLFITAPEGIKGEYESAIANFGLPQYGGSLEGMVLYPKSDSQLCSVPDAVSRGGPGELPHILLVDRGSCYFSDKVYNAQLAGASAVIVTDDKEEKLITMDAPGDDPQSTINVNNITIPSALVQKHTGDAIKKALKNGEMVTVSLDWKEALPHPDDRVEYEFWTNSNDRCGDKCNLISEFITNFKGYGVTLESGGYTLFSPRYITWYCPAVYLESKQCKTQCINHGRYCAPDPESDFDKGYDGKDVVVQNLRELCVFRVANETLKKPWLWWDYVTDFKKQCRMEDNNFNTECAERVATALGVNVRKVRDCIGDTEKDEDNPLLKAEQAAQVGNGGRGDVTILPTIIINNRQYRGKLDAMGVLRAICSGFKETTDPPVCLGSNIQTNECLTNNGGCWHDFNLTACKDTFRGRVCECPKDPHTGIYLTGDGYTKCEPIGLGRCLVNNGGCWQDDANGKHYSACTDPTKSGKQCECPEGFEGDGLTCKDIDECADPKRTVCSCPECQCTNTYGSYDCSCSSSNLVYLKDSDQCISSSQAGSSQHLAGMIVGIVLGAVLLILVVGYVIYKYRLRAYMDSEIRAIMAQYMPLDSQNEPISRQPILENEA